MKNNHPFSSEEFKEIYSRATRLCVDLVIKTPEGVVLSLRNIPPWKGRWHLPGGTVFYKERIADTVRRVALEALEIKIFKELPDNIIDEQRVFLESVWNKID